MGEDHFDSVPPPTPRPEEAAAKPPWDQREADRLIGKYVLAGVTYLASDDETVLSQLQYHGKITKAEPRVGFTIECEGASAGKTMVLPPDLRAFQVAGMGQYRLRSTGEVINDPDMLTTLSVVQHSKS
jgi:hypothetical protein